MVSAVVSGTAAGPVLTTCPAGLKINTTAWIELMDTFIIPQAFHLVPEGGWFLLLDNAPAHKSAASRKWYVDTLGEDMLGFQPPSSPDLSPLDYHLWSSMQGVLPDKIPNVGDLRTKLMKAYNEVKVSDNTAFQSNWKTYYKRLEACIAAGGGHFET